MDVQNGNMTTTAKMQKRELSNVVKKSGERHKIGAEVGGVKQHWIDEVHEDDGTPIKNNTMDENDYAKEVQMSMDMLTNSNGYITAWDDVTNTELDPEGLRAARKLKMKFFKDMNAYTRCPAECVEQENGKLIDTKWIKRRCTAHLQVKVSRKTILSTQRRLIVCIHTTT